MLNPELGNPYPTKPFRGPQARRISQHRLHTPRFPRPDFSAALKRAALHGRAQVWSLPEQHLDDGVHFCDRLSERET
jgi:hypothetical protein